MIRAPVTGHEHVIFGFDFGEGGKNSNARKSGKNIGESLVLMQPHSFRHSL